MQKIHSGKGDDQLFDGPFDFVDLGKILGETTPTATAGKPLQITKANYQNTNLNPDGEPIGSN